MTFSVRIFNNSYYSILPLPQLLEESGKSGTTGSTGPASTLNFRGVWDSGANYSTGDAV
jgi:hypothetical protein|uniref:Uncharacterized protein n=1 Tax=viral metagenome TaxID=1070528 RepID=A0A6C0J3U0_9ZZZZ